MYLYALLDAIFPPTPDELVVRGIDSDDMIQRYRYECVAQIASLLPFSDTATRGAIHLAKFNAHRRAIRILGDVLSHHLSQVDKSYLILPVPLSKSRQRARGHNQVESIVRSALSRHDTAHQLASKLLLRSKHTAPQTSLSREARQTNVIDAFKLYDQDLCRAQVAGKHLLIVDDVTTTGATLKAARAPLAPLSPASITLLAIAH